MSTDPKTQHELFVAGVTLLGGPRAAARALDVGDRTMTRLIAGEAELHDGFLRDMANAMQLHALACRALEKRLNPLFTNNLRPDQPREDKRRTGARHRDDSHADLQETHDRMKAMSQDREGLIFVDPITFRRLDGKD